MGGGLDDITERRPYNAVSDFVDVHVARGLAGKVAFVDPDRSLSYGDLQARSIRFANALRALGLESEKRVALLLNDTVDYPVAFWGTLRSGNIAIPLNTFLNVSQYAYILADCRAGALVVAAPLARTIWPLIEKLPHLRTVILVDAIVDDKAAFPGRDVHLFEDVLAAADATPFTADTVSDEVAFWLYTSGSTGDPKGVKHVHSNLMVTAKLFGQGVLGITENDVVHSAAKLFFAYGLGNAMTFPLSVGATAALWPERPSPDSVLEMMRKHRPTIFYGVPSLYTALLAHKEIGNGAGSGCLRLCVSAGEALPAHIGERWRATVGV
ncbi:MAG TPA: AMP-binding protein, partial [Pseudolabrys sp.]